MSSPRRPLYPDPHADERDWPLGMGADGKLNIVKESEPDEGVVAKPKRKRNARPK